MSSEFSLKNICIQSSITFKDLCSLVPGNLTGRQMMPFMKSSNSLFKNCISLPGPMPSNTLTNTSNVIWSMCCLLIHSSTERSFNEDDFKKPPTKPCNLL